jgi:hypothetical protein
MSDPSLGTALVTGASTGIGVVYVGSARANWLRSPPFKMKRSGCVSRRRAALSRGALAIPRQRLDIAEANPSGDRRHPRRKRPADQTSNRYGKNAISDCDLMRDIHGPGKMEEPFSRSGKRIQS